MRMSILTHDKKGIGSIMRQAIAKFGRPRYQSKNDMRTWEWPFHDLTIIRHTNCLFQDDLFHVVMEAEVQ